MATGSDFPTSLDSFTDKVDGIDDILAVETNTQSSAIEALQAKVGIDGSADTDSLDYKINNVVISNPTTTRGDILVRDAVGLARLALGARGSIPYSDGTDLGYLAKGTFNQVLGVDSSDLQYKNIKDVLGLSNKNNAIIGCKVTANDYPDYLTAGGASSLTATLDATGTDFVCVIDGTKYTFTADITFSVTAGYSANNTALVNEASWTGASSQEQQSLVFGEKSHESVFINFDGAGSEITNLAEKSRVFFRGVNTSAEVEYCYGEVYGISGATFKLRVLWRGIDSSGTRRKFRDNDTWTLCRATYLFIDTVGAAYTTTVHPVTVDTLPSAGTSGLYIFRKSDQTWHYDDGATVAQVSRLFVGVALSHNATDNLAVCYLPEWNQYKAEYINDGLTKPNVTFANDPSSVSKGLIVNGSVVVGGDTFEFNDSRIATSTAGDLETGTVDIAAIGIKYVYVAQSTGKLYFSDIMPRKLGDEILMHPSKMWRCVGYFLHSASAFLPFTINKSLLCITEQTISASMSGTFANYPVHSGYFPSFLTVIRAFGYHNVNTILYEAEYYSSSTNRLLASAADVQEISPFLMSAYSGYIRAKGTTMQISGYFL